MEDSWSEYLRGYWEQRQRYSIPSQHLYGYEDPAPSEYIQRTRIRRTPSLTRLITFTTIDELMWRLTNGC